MVKPFFDTNILVYAFNISDAKSSTALSLVKSGGAISIQVLNELTNVLRHKLRWNWPDISAALASTRNAMDQPLPLTLDLHEQAVDLARDHGFHIYDATIIASALAARCDTLYTEDLQHGRRFGSLTIVNPFL